MKQICIYVRPIIYSYTVLLLYLLAITIFNYFNIISYKSVSIISFIVIILLYMMLGFTSALKSTKKGYITGFFIGIFNIIIFLIMSLIFGSQIKLNILVYFLILIASSTLGGMFGINYKNKE